MKKKGFTLIELLAVIVILAIIALIAIPLIGNVIEKAKIGALESSVNGLVESANMYYANNTIKGETITETVFDFEDGEQVSDKKLEYKGKVYNGKLILTSDSDVITCIDDGKYYAYKEKDSDEIISGIGTCLYDGTTGDFTIKSDVDVIIKECDEEKSELQNEIDELTEQIGNLQNEINEKEAAINSLQSNLEANQNEIATLTGEKEDLQEALDAKNVELSELNEKITNITATASDVLSGKTILTSSGLVTGTMINNGSVSKTLSINGSYTIPKGYHDGTGKVTQSITTKAAATYTPGTSNQTIASGQYLSGVQTIAGDADLTAANIKSGVNIFGVTGTYKGGGYSSITGGGSVAYRNDMSLDYQVSTNSNGQTVITVSAHSSGGFDSKARKIVITLN